MVIQEPDTPKKRLIKWDGSRLHLYNPITGEMLLLGPINTRKGQLTRVQKLKAVQFTGEWIEI